MTPNQQFASALHTLAPCDRAPVAIDAGCNDLQALGFVLAGIGKFKQAAADKNLYAVGVF